MEQKKTFSELICSEKLVLVDFFATWCGPCQMMQPILQELSGRVSGKASIIKIDVDKNPLVASTYRIQGVPTLMLFRKGEVLWRQSGVLNANQLEQVIHQFYREPVMS
ncbi:MAG: thioredoxin [Cyclobacteriaceae bacterium]|nr:thioredoxin [Cyclobacteriaceae bacterium]